MITSLYLIMHSDITAAAAGECSVTNALSTNYKLQVLLILIAAVLDAGGERCPETS
jgi:hypothetical protein